MIRSTAATALALLAGTVTPAAAQGVIRGLVFDSLLGAPLGGAEVWLRGAPRHAVTDPVGRFRFDSVPAGRYVLAVAHANLDSAGLFNVAAFVTVGGPADTVVVTIGVPSLAAFWRRGCGATLGAGPDSGVVFGTVNEVASGGGLLAGAGVRATWIRLQQGGRAEVLIEEHDARGRTDSTGAYYVCGLPRGPTLRLRAYARADSTGAVDVRLGPRGVARRDLTLALGTTADSGARSAPAVLRGTAMTPEGRPLGRARVTVRDAATTGTERDGAFLLTGLPSGTQWVTVLAIGREPFEQAVVLRPGDTVSLAVTLGPLPVTLDPLRVTAARQSREMAEIEERRRAGWGYVRTEAELERMGSMRAVFTSIPSVRIARSRSVLDVTVLLPSPSAGGNAYCVPPLFIDGFRAEYDELAAYRPSQLLAVEVYPRPSTVPVRFQAVASRCGVVLVWTKYVQ